MAALPLASTACAHSSGGADSIRDFIAFPKNNSGRDVMIDSPSQISAKQLTELSIKTDVVVK
jgi:aspartyl-tRNA synthetase